jgi:hypothetical protein
MGDFTPRAFKRLEVRATMAESRLLSTDRGVIEQLPIHIDVAVEPRALVG